MADLINRLVAEASPFDATKRIVRPDGEVRYIRCVGVPYCRKPKPEKVRRQRHRRHGARALNQELRRREAVPGGSSKT